MHKDTVLNIQLPNDAAPWETIKMEKAERLIFDFICVKLLPMSQEY